MRLSAVGLRKGQWACLVSPQVTPLNCAGGSRTLPIKKEKVCWKSRANLHTQNMDWVKWLHSFCQILQRPITRVIGLGPSERWQIRLEWFLPKVCESRMCHESEWTYSFFSELDSKASNLSLLSQKYKKDARYLNLRSTYAKIAAVSVIVFVAFLYFYIF